MGMFWRGEHTFAELHALGGDIGAYPPPKLTYYVDKLGGGSDSQTGLGSWRNAKATYQAGVTAATCADNRYRDVDLIIAPAEYDEEVVISGVAQDQYSGSTWYGWRMGRLRVISMGEKVILKNSGVDTSHTLDVLRMKVELHGGTFRNYTNTSGAAATAEFAGVHWDRHGLKGALGDVIGGAMYGCRVEGRDSARVGIDFDAASYVHVEDCWISGWNYGVLYAANGFGYPTEGVLYHNRFRDNIYDIMLGGAQHFLMEDNIHMDSGTTQFIGVSTLGGRTGTVTDSFCVNGRFNTSGWAKLPTMSGVKFTGTALNDR